MFFSGIFLGASTFTSVPLLQLYEDIKVYGGAKIGYMKLSDYQKLDDELDSIDVTKVPEWDVTTGFLATFDTETTDAGNVQNISTIEKWEIYRRAIDEGTFSYLGSVDGDAELYSDYTAKNNKTYKYQIFPMSDTQVGSPLETGFEEVDIDYWYLIDEELSVSYRFQFNVTTGTIENRNGQYIEETQSKYPTYIKNGEMDYDRGSIRVMIGSLSTGSWEQDVTELEEFKEFINNGETKMLKSRKGKIWRVKTYNYSETPFNERIASQPYEINFDWVEIEEF